MYVLNKSERKGSRWAQSLFFFYPKSPQTYKISPSDLKKVAHEKIVSKILHVQKENTIQMTSRLSS